MSVFGSIFLAMLATLGVVLSVIEFERVRSAKKASFITLCFREDLLEGGLPDMVVICRTDAEQEEIIRRVLADEKRQVFLKRW